MIEQIYDPDLKKTIAREILEALREWFEVDESREKYIADCAEWIFFAAKEAGKGYASIPEREDSVGPCAIYTSNAPGTIYQGRS